MKREFQKFMNVTWLLLSTERQTLWQLAKINVDVSWELFSFGFSIVDEGAKTIIYRFIGEDQKGVLNCKVLDIKIVTNFFCRHLKIFLWLIYDPLTPMIWREAFLKVLRRSSFRLCIPFSSIFSHHFMWKKRNWRDDGASLMRKGEK